MPLHRLPPELLDAVCHHLEPNHLPAVAESAKSLLPVAQRRLYRHLSISAITHNLNLIPLLAKKPSLASHVRSFAVRLQSSTLFFSFYRLLATALSNMTQLTSLQLFVDPQASWILAAEIPRCYPRLLHFSCSFALDSHVATFLSKADALSHIELDDSFDDTLEIEQSIPPLPSATIPHLTQFIGSSRAANTIVPGRPVHTIHLLSGDIAERDILNLAKSSAPVVIFGATTSCLPAPLLDTLARSMPHLAYLRIMTTYNFANAPDVVSFEKNFFHWCEYSSY
jgi:hypothetical protein